MEILAPSLFRSVFEALVGREVADCPELALLTVDRGQLDNPVTRPIPASELVADHIEVFRESHGSDRDGKGLGVERDLVVTCGGNGDVSARLDCRELLANLRSEAFGDAVGVRLVPGVVVTDLEAARDVHHRACPDISVLSHHEVIGPRVAADFPDERIDRLVLLDEDCLAGIVVGDVIDTGLSHLDVLAADGEGLAKLRLEHAIDIARVDGACGVLLRPADRHGPFVVSADLELVACRDLDAADLPDVAGSVGQVEIGIPSAVVEGSDERPCSRFLRLRRVSARGRLILAVHRGAEFDGLLVEVEIDAVLAGSHGDVVTAYSGILAPVVVPCSVGAELDLGVGSELGVSPETDIVLVVVHLDVRLSAPVVEPADDSDDIGAPVLGEKEGVLVKGEPVETLAVADDVLRAVAVDEL